MKRLFVIFMALCVCIGFLGRPMYVSVMSDLVFSKNDSKIKKVALTFDDGPHPRYTHQILEILAEYGVTATFFVIGINAERYPEAMAELASSGCEIGNHTYSHNSIQYAGQAQIEQELLDCQRQIFSQTGQTPTLFRPPEGRFNQSLEQAAACMNYRIILWSIDTKDWAHTPSQIIVREVLTQIEHGDIIFMHDYISGTNTTCDALRSLIPTLQSKGYEFVSVSELINGDDR